MKFGTQCFFNFYIMLVFCINFHRKVLKAISFRHDFLKNRYIGSDLHMVSLNPYFCKLILFVNIIVSADFLQEILVNKIFDNFKWSFIWAVVVKEVKCNPLSIAFVLTLPKRQHNVIRQNTTKCATCR